MTIDLTNIPLFEALPGVARRQIAAALRRVTVQPQELIFRQDEAGDRLCIVLQGTVEVFKALEAGQESFIRTLGPGSLIGELSLFDRQGLRTASVRAQSEAVLATMTHDDFQVLLRDNPALGIELSRQLTLRLNDAHNATIDDLQERNRQLEKAYRELQDAQAQIIEKERLEQELRLAHDLQQSMLPGQLPRLAGFDFAATMVPARAVGGDFYDFVPLESGNVGIVIADVSDKGMPAALFMALTRSLIRAEASRGVFPPDVLRRVNRHLLEISESGMFVTVLYGILHGRNGEFLYARAGHELPLLFDAAGQVVALPSSRGQPLGLLPDPDLDEQSILLRPGHRLVLTTDGVTDAINRQQEEFGRERLQRLVSRQTDVSARAVCELVHEAVKAHEEGMPQFDDFTLVVVQTQLAGAR